MTLEELGRSYLKQAEELKITIDELKAEISKDRRRGISDSEKIDRLCNMEETYSELYINGYELINYYKK